MYQMVHLAMRTSQARERLLAAAVGHALDTGIADLSLRQLAAATGTSHRMLLYHFGSREGLLAAVTEAVEEQQRASLLEPGTTSAHHARQSWQRFSDPRLWPQERLFFELYAYALRGRPGTEGFLARASHRGSRMRLRRRNQPRLCTPSIPSSRAVFGFAGALVLISKVLPRALRCR